MTWKVWREDGSQNCANKSVLRKYNLQDCLLSITWNPDRSVTLITANMFTSLNTLKSHLSWWYLLSENARKVFNSWWNLENSKPIFVVSDVTADGLIPLGVRLSVGKVMIFFLNINTSGNTTDTNKNTVQITWRKCLSQTLVLQAAREDKWLQRLHHTGVYNAWNWGQYPVTTYKISSLR